MTYKLHPFQSLTKFHISPDRVVVMGAAKVGKTAIINQFLYDTFTQKYTKTIEEMHHGEYEVSGYFFSQSMSGENLLDVALGQSCLPSRRKANQGFISWPTFDTLILQYPHDIRGEKGIKIPYLLTIQCIFYHGIQFSYIVK